MAKVVTGRHKPNTGLNTTHINYIKISPKTKPTISAIKVKPINHHIVLDPVGSPRIRNIQTNFKALMTRDFGI
jgi:hypothetical protein